jgi:hypothetical protein
MSYGTRMSNLRTLCEVFTCSFHIVLNCTPVSIEGWLTKSENTLPATYNLAVYFLVYSLGSAINSSQYILCVANPPAS